jgi:hypothetical protein
MARYSNRMLERLIDAMGAGEAALRPEQVARITAIAQEPDPVRKGRMTMALMQELLQEAAALQQRLASRSGRAASVKQALPDSLRKEVESAAEDYRHQVAEELEREARQAVQASRGTRGRPPRAGRISV